MENGGHEKITIKKDQSSDLDGVLSEPQDIICGIPQGSIQGPLLFLVFINDLPAAVKCTLLLYADDSALLVSGKEVREIENSLGSEQKAGTKKKLSRINTLNVSCNGTEIKPQKTVSYLGLDREQSLSGKAVAGKNLTAN